MLEWLEFARCPAFGYPPTYEPPQGAPFPPSSGLQLGRTPGQAGEIAAESRQGAGCAAASASPRPYPRHRALEDDEHALRWLHNANYDVERARVLLLCSVGAGQDEIWLHYQRRRSLMETEARASRSTGAAQTGVCPPPGLEVDKAPKTEVAEEALRQGGECRLMVWRGYGGRNPLIPTQTGADAKRGASVQALRAHSAWIERARAKLAQRAPSPDIADIIALHAEGSALAVPSLPSGVMSSSTEEVLKSLHTHLTYLKERIDRARSWVAQFHDRMCPTFHERFSVEQLRSMVKDAISVRLPVLHPLPPCLPPRFSLRRPRLFPAPLSQVHVRIPEVRVLRDLLSEFSAWQRDCIPIPPRKAVSVFELRYARPARP